MNNIDISACLSKLDNSISRHTSLSSPCSQLSSDGECKDRINHVSEVSSKFDGSHSMIGRVNGETVCAGPVSDLLDGEHVVERVNSQGSSSNISGNGVHMKNSTNKMDSIQPIGTPQEGPPKVVNSQNHEDGSNLGFINDSQNSVESYSAEPLPEMSVQDAESVLGMSPSPYPSQEGPATPSAGVPSPSHFPSSHFPPHGPHGATPTLTQQPGTPGSVGTPTGVRGGSGAAAGGGSQDFSIDMDMGGAAATPGLGAGGAVNSVPTPPSYPPPYPVDVPGYHHSPYGPSNYPPYNSNPSFQRQYDIF